MADSALLTSHTVTHYYSLTLPAITVVQAEHHHDALEDRLSKCSRLLRVFTAYFYRVNVRDIFPLLCLAPESHLHTALRILHTVVKHSPWSAALRETMISFSEVVNHRLPK